jgi:hypothetical protein
LAIAGDEVADFENTCRCHERAMQADRALRPRADPTGDQVAINDALQRRGAGSAGHAGFHDRRRKDSTGYAAGRGNADPARTVTGGDWTSIDGTLSRENGNYQLRCTYFDHLVGPEHGRLHFRDCVKYRKSGGG